MIQYGVVIADNQTGVRMIRWPCTADNQIMMFHNGQIYIEKVTMPDNQNVAKLNNQNLQVTAVGNLKEVNGFHFYTEPRF